MLGIFVSGSKTRIERDLWNGKT